MKTLLLLASLAMVQTTAFAHEEHDWRLDYQGYLSVEYTVTPMNSFKMKKAKRVNTEFYKNPKNFS